MADNIDRKSFPQLERFIYMIPNNRANNSAVYVLNNYLSSVNANKSFRDIYALKGLSTGHYSSKHLDEKPEQFSRAIEMAILRSSSDINDINEWQERALQNHPSAEQKLIDLVKPVLRNLINMGYVREDLRVG